LFFEPLDSMHKRFDLKFKRLDSQGYRFVANPERERLMAKNAGLMLLAQIQKNISERELRGIDQSEVKVLLKSLISKDNEFTQNNITKLKAQKLYK